MSAKRKSRKALRHRLRTQRLGEVGVEISPRLAHGLRAARHGDWFEPSDAPVIAIIGEQKLATPDRAIIAEANSIEDDPEHRHPIERIAVFGETGRDMGVVMLDFDKPQPPLARLYVPQL